MRNIVKRFVWPSGQEAKVSAHFRASSDASRLDYSGDVDLLRVFLGSLPKTGYGCDFEYWWTQHNGRDGVRVETTTVGDMVWTQE